MKKKHYSLQSTFWSEIYYLRDVVVGLWLPAVHLVELDGNAWLADVHPELLGLGAGVLVVVSNPLLPAHGASEQKMGV